MMLRILLVLSCVLALGMTGVRLSNISVLRKRQVELVVVVDTSLAWVLAGEVRPYVLGLLGAVDRLYRHPSLGSEVRLAVVRVEVLWDQAQGPRVSSDARQTLHDFCRWQQDRRAMGDWSQVTYDAALLLTRQNLCQEDFCESLGLGHIGTVCEADGGQNCAVVQDIGLQSAFTIAHEIGHLLGMAHDNSEICAFVGEISSGHQMMSPMLSRIDFSKPWSRCSARLSLGFFASGRADCLLNEPSVSLADSAPLAGATYDRDVQCRLTFGPGHRARPGLDPCPMLWCVARHQGEWHHASKQLPAADGTPCGAGAVCLQGTCTHNWKQLAPIDGSWGSWGLWAPCSRSCGGGVQFSRRRCNNPIPANHGQFCLGRWETFRSCNLDRCAVKGRTFRQEQCAERNGLTMDGEQQEWEPYHHGIRWADLCKLNCLLQGTSRVTVFSAKVKDGTRCFPHSDAVCVRSQCVRTGCDLVIGSSKRYSPCGVCGGEAIDCKRVIHHFHGKAMNYTDVAVIPRGAAGLKVRQQPRRGQGRFSAYLALRREDGSYALNGGGQITAFESLIEAGGVALRYPGWRPRRDLLEAITRAPLSQSLQLQVYNPSSRRLVRITYSYYLRRGGDQEGQGSQPTGRPRPAPRPVPTLGPTPAHSLVPAPYPTPAPRLVPALYPTPAPRPVLTPMPDTTLGPTAASRPIPTQDSTPAPSLVSAPYPTPAPRLVPALYLTTAPRPVLTPMPDTTLGPTAAPRPSPAPSPVPTPRPVLTPDPTPPPRPVLTPRPVFTTDPTPIPRPVPTMAPLDSSIVPTLDHTPIPTIDPTPVPSRVTTSAPAPTPRPAPDWVLTQVPTPGSWLAGPWQLCSVSCGVGWVARRVSCVDRAGKQARGCDQELRPHGMALCVRGSCRRGGS